MNEIQQTFSNFYKNSIKIYETGLNFSFNLIIISSVNFWQMLLT